METIGTVFVVCCSAFPPGLPTHKMTSGARLRELRAELLRYLSADNAPAILDSKIAADDPAELLKLLSACPRASLDGRVLGALVIEPADPPHPLRPLRMRSERPRRCAGEQRDAAESLQWKLVRALSRRAGRGVTARWAGSYADCPRAGRLNLVTPRQPSGPRLSPMSYT
jgi:hypothetical protein